MDLTNNDLITIGSYVSAPISSIATWFFTRRSNIKKDKSDFESTLLKRVEDISEKYLDVQQKYTEVIQKFYENSEENVKLKSELLKLRDDHTRLKQENSEMKEELKYLRTCAGKIKEQN